MNRLKVYGVTCVLMLASLAARATTIVMPTDEQLVAKSPVIADGTVLSQSVVLEDGAVWTLSDVAVARAIKGDVAGTITVRQLGGEMGDRITKIFGAAELTVGERVLLFLEKSPRGGYRTVDLFVGKFSEETAMNGERLWVRHDFEQDATILDSDLRPMPSVNVQRDATAFESFVFDRLAGRRGVKNYGVENPVLARDVKADLTPQRVEANFTLISDPTIYRWFRFDSGQTAQWYSAGTQPGYTDGGVSETRTAMGSWNNYSSAKINYSYIGSRTGSMGGLGTPNGVNEVLFNDPLNEISGSWNGSGGVVGQGGFNGVSSQQNWTAPFAADASHPAGALRAWNITEGNLVIQDGVSSGSGISSSRLAEILAHEFGHTLGFGHSADSTALMYYSVTGRGPSLRADDQLAARWLYPNGTSTQPAPQVPAAPTSLTGSASSNSIALAWKDNASDETGQAIYLAAGNGAFSKVAQVGANVTSTKLSSLAAGTYRVYVVAFNGTGNSSPSNTVTVSIAAVAGPVAQMNVSPLTGTAGVTSFVFSDVSTGTVQSRVWNFGDGTPSSTAMQAAHVYAKAGQYTATLSVTGNGLTSQTSKSISVQAPVPVTPAVVASFDASASSTTTGTTVSFFDRSTGSPTSWAWSFGDGATSAAQNPSHAFASAGTYTVTLTARNATSSSVATRQVSVTTPAPAPEPAAYRALVSVVAQTAGVGGTSWRTELNVFNAGTQGASVTLIFLPSAGGNPVSRSMFLSPRQSVTYANALRDLFGMSSGAGALAIEATSAGAAANLRVTSRTFTGGSEGTYGQSVPELPTGDLQKTLYITGIISNAKFRTNVGLVNSGASAMSATLALYNATGTAVATKTLSLPAKSFQQTPLSTLFPQVSGVLYNVLSMRIAAPSQDAISAYASVVDNATQDPILIQAMPAASGTSLTVPVVGRSAGVNGTFWRSDVTVMNPSSSQTSITLRYGSASKVVTIGAGDTMLLDDVLSDFGIASGSGALRMTWSGAGPVVTSRTYTTVATGGTFGQSIDPVAAFTASMFVPGLRNDGSYRSNVGFVNGGAETESFYAILLSPYGTELARTTLTLAPGDLAQYGVAALFPNAALGSGFTLQIAGDGNAKLFAYGSMVDNRSGDPVFFAGR